MYEPAPKLKVYGALPGRGSAPQATSVPLTVTVRPVVLEQPQPLTVPLTVKQMAPVVLKFPLWPPVTALQVPPPLLLLPPLDDELLELELLLPPPLEEEELELELLLPPGTTAMPLIFGFWVPVVTLMAIWPPLLAVAVNDLATALFWPPAVA